MWSRRTMYPWFYDKAKCSFKSWEGGLIMWRCSYCGKDLKLSYDGVRALIAIGSFKCPKCEQKLEVKDDFCRC